MTEEEFNRLNREAFSVANRSKTTKEMDMEAIRLANSARKKIVERSIASETVKPNINVPRKRKKVNVKIVVMAVIVAGTVMYHPVKYIVEKISREVELSNAKEYVNENMDDWLEEAGVPYEIVDGEIDLTSEKDDVNEKIIKYLMSKGYTQSEAIYAISVTGTEAVNKAVQGLGYKNFNDYLYKNGYFDFIYSSSGEVISKAASKEIFENYEEEGFKAITEAIRQAQEQANKINVEQENKGLGK